MKVCFRKYQHCGLQLIFKLLFLPFSSKLHLREMLFMKKIHPGALAGVAGCPSPQEQDLGATVDIQTSQQGMGCPHSKPH